MANRERGEVSIDIDGTSYTLCLDINAMCRVEEMFSTAGREVTFQEVLERVQAGSFRHIRAVLWACFLKHQPTLTVEQLSELSVKSGGLTPFVDRLLSSLGLQVTPDPKDLKTLGVNGRPRKAQTRTRGAGIGGSSTVTGAGSV